MKLSFVFQFNIPDRVVIKAHGRNKKGRTHGNIKKGQVI